MFEVEAMFETAKGEPLSIVVKTVGSAQKPTRSKGPAILVVASFQEGFF